MRFYPCEATLLDGSVAPRVLLVDVTPFRQREAELRRAGRDLRLLDVSPWPKQTIGVQALVEVRDSRWRIPPHLAQPIYDQGETHMGGYGIRLVFDGLESLFYGAGNIIDFPDLPSTHPPERLRGAYAPGGGARNQIGPADFEVAHFW